MAVTQLHLNDLDKTPIEPVISTGSIPNGAVTEEKLANNLFTPLGNPKKPETKPEYVMFDENLDGFKVSLDYSKIEYDKTGEYPEPDFDGLTTVGYVQAKLDKKQNSLTAGSITSDLIADSAVTKAKIALKTITANEIADGTISTAQLDNQVVSNINNAVNQSSSAQSMADTANTIATSAKAIAEANKAKLDRINTDLLVVVSDVQSVQDEVKTKQANLVSGTNIKTVNGNSLLGAGDISISGGGTSYPRIYNINLDKANSDKLFSTSVQPKGTKVIINDSNLSDYDIIKINSNDGHASSLLYLTTKTYFIIYENLMALYSDMITGSNKWRVMVFYAEGSKNIELEIM